MLAPAVWFLSDLYCERSYHTVTSKQLCYNAGFVTILFQEIFYIFERHFDTETSRSFHFLILNYLERTIFQNFLTLIIQRVEIRKSDTGEKWEYNGTVHQPFTDFKKANDSVRREVFIVQYSQ
jgi:hypothetical protein